MKFVFGCVVLGITLCFGHPGLPEWVEYKDVLEDEEWSFVPQMDGSFQLMSHKQAELEYKLSPLAGSDLVVTFHLFTRLNPDKPQFVRENNTSTLTNSNFNPKHPTRIVTHGWWGHVNAKMNRLIRPALLERGDYNVFIVDWSSAARTFNYFTARYSVDEVSSRIADFIDFLHLYGGMKFEDLTLIGHSLGAHASGLAGKKVTKGRIQTIIGLDPALPLFSYNNPDERLDPSDAKYVQTIHTNGDYLAFHVPLGHASFYPNGGKVQPGCSFDAAGICAHRRSYEYFAESLSKNNSFIPFDCFEYYKLIQDKCYDLVKSVRMGGEPADYDYPAGIFYVPTNSKEPYGLGVVER